jgi:hypothetical protein
MNNIDDEIEKLHDEMEREIEEARNHHGSVNMHDIRTERHGRLLILLSKKEEEQSKRIIGLTQSLVELGKNTEKYTINLITLTKWIVGLTVVVAIVGFFPIIEGFIPKNKNEKPAANKERQDVFISSSKPQIDTLTGIKPSSTQRKNEIKDKK